MLRADDGVWLLKMEGNVTGVRDEGGLLYVTANFDTGMSPYRG